MADTTQLHEGAVGLSSWARIENLSADLERGARPQHKVINALGIVTGELTRSATPIAAMEITSLHLPFRVDPDAEDRDMQALIESWTYRGAATAWSAVVGHERQLDELRRLAMVLETAADEPLVLEQLGIRTAGRGALLLGPAGVGKTVAARALATATGRDAIVVPTAELDAPTIRRLYAQLGRSSNRSAVVLDEADRLIGAPWMVAIDAEAQAALLAALDGIERPGTGPLTIAISSLDDSQVLEAMKRPGRLSPRLVFDLPTRADRRVLLTRGLRDRPTSRDVDLEECVERSDGWSGAEIDILVESAAVRALADGSRVVSQDHLRALLAERFVLVDRRRRAAPDWAVAVHEAGHAVYAALTQPAGIDGLIEVRLAGPGDGWTKTSSGTVPLMDDLPGTDVEGMDVEIGDAMPVPTLTEIRRQIGQALAGRVAEVLVLGSAEVVAGNTTDTAVATRLAMQLADECEPWSYAALDAPGHSSGSMRDDRYRVVRELAAVGRTEAERVLTPRTEAIRLVANRLLETPGFTLSGLDLQAVVRDALAG